MTTARTASRSPHEHLRMPLTAVALATCALAGPATAVPPQVAPPAGEIPDLVATPGDSTPITTVHSAVELAAVLRSPFRGRIMIPRDADWTMNDPCGALDEFGRCAPTPLKDLPIRSGVELIGQRGFLGRRPVLHATFLAERYELFQTIGNGIRVQGIHFRGPSRGRSKSLPVVTAVRVISDPVGQTGRRVTIADNEFDGWTNAGVDVCGNYAPVALETPGCTVGPRGPIEHTGPLTTPADASSLRIERNYFHHNARDSAGYGVVLSGNAYATIEGNVFDFNRHDITSDGRAFNGYVARFNYVLQGGFTYGNGYWGQHFDVHGSGTPESRKNGHYDGGMAGEFYEIAFNTFRGEQRYGGFAGVARKTRAAFELRGRPTVGARFMNNVVVHDDRSEAVRLKGLPGGPAIYNLTVGGNRYDTDYSAELASGDFDGDGRSDAFVANGTGWFMSRGASEPWEFLRPSNKRIRDLAFVDVDNDRVTDVLYRDPAGNLGVVARGTARDVAFFTTLPVAISALRSGDFDADGRTDLFATWGGQWWIWHGSTRVWTAVQTSSASISNLLVGEFDDTPGTDVATVLRDRWAVSSGATAPWARLNARLASSFSDAVAADFDGNGRTDIAVSSGGRWRVSFDGRGPLTVLRQGDGSLRQMLVGRFDGGVKATVVRFDPRGTTPFSANDQRFVIWRGLGSGNGFAVHSRQNMR